MTDIKTSLRRFYHTAIPLQMKYGGGFGKKFRLYLELQHASREEVQAYQWSRLKALLDYAYAHVPYYTRLFDSLGIHPNDIHTRDDFRKIPVLHKDDVIANHELLKSDEFQQLKPVQTTTSATTRDGMVMYRSACAETVRSAIVWRYWHNLGYNFRDSRVHFAQNKKLEDDFTIPHLDLNENCLQLDPRSICHEHAPLIYKRINEMAPKMIFGQPSNLVSLVNHWRDHELKPLTIPLIFVLGEKVYPEYRAILSEFFKGAVRDYYGNRENTASAGELDDGLMYINSDFTYLEFEDDNGNVVQGTPANIISTGFENYAFPLIRYHTEDVGIYRGYPDRGLTSFDTMEVVGGRGRDLLLTRNGLFCPTVVGHLRKVSFTRYRRVQLHQMSLDRLIVRIEPSEDFERERDIPIVQKAYQDFFKDMFTIEVEVVDRIASTPALKFMLVKSDIAQEALRKSISRGR